VLLHYCHVLLAAAAVLLACRMLLAYYCCDAAKPRYIAHVLLVTYVTVLQCRWMPNNNFREFPEAVCKLPAIEWL
jgi:hypothetical protein